MRKQRRIVFGMIIVLMIIGIAIFYFSQRDWCEIQGWSGEYNKDSVLMEGVQGLECICSTNTRIVYSYAIEYGGVELKVTRDAEGKDAVRIITVTEETCNGTITFENIEPEKYYVHETALSKDSEYFAEGRLEVYRTKWKQLLLNLAFRYGINLDEFDG